jgi:hypothetical protein
MEACAMPALLFKIALIIIVVRSLYQALKYFDSAYKSWLELLYHLAVAVAALSFLL